jgi:hypothetical protein
MKLIIFINFNNDNIVIFINFLEINSYQLEILIHD